MGRVPRCEIRFFATQPSIIFACLGCTRMYRFTVDLDTHFIENDDRKGAIPDPGIVAEPPRNFLAMLDCIAGCRKFYPTSISDWNAVLQFKIESSHHASCDR